MTTLNYVIDCLYQKGNYFIICLDWKEEIQVVKDICNYIYETYGRFPAFSDPMFLRFMVQAHHLDLDFYDKYYPPGAYTENHKNHFKLWHPDIPDPFEGK